MEEKRRHKRLELSGEILIKQLGASNSADTAETADIEIIDCSREGIGFQTDKILQTGSTYETTLTLWNKDRLHVFIQIIRAVNMGNTFQYGGIFIGMPDQDRMRIQVYETIEEELANQKEP